MNNKFHKNSYLIINFFKDFLINEKSNILICFILLIIVSLTTSIYPFLIQKVFDNFNENTFPWFLLPILIAIVATIRGLTMYFQMKYVSKIALKVGIEIQKKLSNHLLLSDLEFILKTSSGKHISRIMNDVNMIRDGLERAINNLIRDVITMVILIFYLIWLDWALALIVLLIYPLALRPIINVGSKQKLYALLLQEHMEKLTSYLSEIFRGIAMIKSYSLEKIEQKRINSSFNDYFLKFYDLVKGRAKVLPILEILGGLAASFVILFASYRISSGYMTIGSVVGFITALLMLAQPARALGTFNTSLQEGLSALSRIYGQLKEVPNIENSSNKRLRKLKLIKRPIIEFKNVSFYYEKDKMILKNISFKLDQSKIEISGKSGEGKTTIFNLICRFFDPKEGNIYINGINLKDIKLSSLRDNVSLVSQDTVIYNDTFYNNILLGNLNASKMQVIQSAKSADIHDYIIGQTNGYDTIIGEAGSTLSGGQKQRISIARAFLKNSKILLLDEVTSALDKNTAKKVLSSIKKLTLNKLCIYINHNETKLSSRCKILRLKNGKLI